MHSEGHFVTIRGISFPENKPSELVSNNRETEEGRHTVLTVLRKLDIRLGTLSMIDQATQ